MSEVHKPAEEPVLAPVAATEELNAPATEATVDPIRPTGTDTLVPESRPEVTAGADTAAGNHTGADALDSTGNKLGPNETTVTAQPISEGILGHKAPGLIKSLRFSKKFFWLGHDSVEPNLLSGYLRSEKQEIAHPNVAHASQTGKGLLFFTKRVEDKAQPAGIINLAEASDVTKEGYNEFSFRIHGQRHTFEAPTHAERDSWLVAIEKQITEAKASREAIVGSDGYKHHMENLGKPSTLVGAPAANSRSRSTPAKKSLDEKIADGARNGDAVVSSNSSSADESATKRKTKSRSQSRKRASIFGSLLGGKKEEHDEKKELKKEEKAELKAEKEERKEEKSIEKGESKAGTDGHEDGAAGTSLDAEAIADRVMNEPEVPGDEILPKPVAEIVQPAPNAVETTTPSSTTREHAPKPSKRNSLFGSLFNKVSSPSQEKTEKEISPAVPVKETETAPVSAVAPQLADPVDTAASKPVPTSNEADAVTPGTSNTRHPLTSSSPPKGGIFAFMKGKDVRSEDKREMKAEEKAEKRADEPTLATGTPTAPGSGAPAPITTTNGSLETPAQGTTGTGSPTTPDAVKEKRRSSLFGTLGGKKDRTTEVTGETGAIDGETKPKQTSSGMLGSLFRKPSRAVRGEKEMGKKHTANPTTVDESNKASTPIEETPTTTTEPTTTMHETATESQANGVTPAQNVPVHAAA